MSYVVHTRRDHVNEDADLRALLLNDDAAPTWADIFVDDVDADVLVGSGYTGPVTLAGLVRTVGSTPDEILYSFDAPDFGTIVAGETALWLVVYEHVTNAADSPLVVSMKLGTTGIPTDGTPMILAARNDVWFILPGGAVA